MTKKRVKPRRKWVFFILRNQSSRKLKESSTDILFCVPRTSIVLGCPNLGFKAVYITIHPYYSLYYQRDTRYESHKIEKNISVISIYIFHACFLKKEVVEVMEVIPVILHIVTTYLLHILISMKAHNLSIGLVAHLQSIVLWSERGGFESRCQCHFLGSMLKIANSFSY